MRGTKTQLRSSEMIGSCLYKSVDLSGGLLSVPLMGLCAIAGVALQQDEKSRGACFVVVWEESCQIEDKFVF